MRQESIEDFFRDTLTLHKPDGRVFENIRGLVSNDRILLAEGLLPVSIGDRVTRKLPNGLVEEFIIDQWQYHKAIDEVPLPARFVVTVHRAGSADFPGQPSSISEKVAPPTVAAQRMVPENHNATKRRRRDIIQKYRREHELETMDLFARHVGVSLTAIHGMVREDRTRYSEEKLETLLKKIGIPRKDW